MICTGETYKDYVKVTFAKGASLDDPSGLFNSSLDGNTRRAIDFREDDKIDEKAFQGAHPRGREPEHVPMSEPQRADCRLPSSRIVGELGLRRVQTRRRPA